MLKTEEAFPCLIWEGVSHRTSWCIVSICFWPKVCLIQHSEVCSSFELQSSTFTSLLGDQTRATRAACGCSRPELQDDEGKNLYTWENDIQSFFLCHIVLVSIFLQSLTDITVLYLLCVSFDLDSWNRWLDFDR